MVVTLYPALSELSRVGADGSRVALAGEYTVRFGLRETKRRGMGFVEAKLLAY